MFNVAASITDFIIFKRFPGKCIYWASCGIKRVSVAVDSAIIERSKNSNPVKCAHSSLYDLIYKFKIKTSHFMKR